MRNAPARSLRAGKSYFSKIATAQGKAASEMIPCDELLGLVEWLAETETHSFEARSHREARAPVASKTCRPEHFYPLAASLHSGIPRLGRRAHEDWMWLQSRAATVSAHCMFELSLAKEKLQVAANAAEEEILQAWKKLVLLLHPDKPAPQLSSIASVFRGTNKAFGR
ncbi:unnamed protein product [Symbiodinium sp. CCMP2592]|nr:unnamed protein product [Symbiodinium sp. CCMP2592]